MIWPEACIDCGTKEHLTFWAIPMKSDPYALCRDCRKTPTGVPDVYWDGKPEENLADGPDGKPITFSSKGEKAAYLKSRGIMEAGDRYHGAPVSSIEMEARRKEINRERGRQEIRESLERVKNMDPRRRRAEYQRIVKEGERHARFQ